MIFQTKSNCLTKIIFFQSLNVSVWFSLQIGILYSLMYYDKIWDGVCDKLECFSKIITVPLPLLLNNSLNTDAIIYLKILDKYGLKWNILVKS